jgi:hypothetical protein
MKNVILDNIKKCDKVIVGSSGIFVVSKSPAQFGNGDFSIIYNTASTGNCQLAVFGYINALLYRYNAEEIAIFFGEFDSFIQFLSTKLTTMIPPLSTVGMQPLILFDVKEANATQETFKSVFTSKYILSNTSYVSTNGSMMNLILFKALVFMQDYKTNNLEIVKKVAKSTADLPF